MSEKESNVYMIHKFLAVFLDLVVIFVFVIIGVHSHNDDASFKNIIRVALPFIAAYFPLMLIFAKDLRNMKTAAIASVISIPIAMFLRYASSSQYVSYSLKFPFPLIALIFLTVFFVGWRFLLGKLRPSAPSAS